MDGSEAKTKQVASETEGLLPQDERDEIKEIERFSRAETRRVSNWRLTVTTLLLTTGVGVSVATYYLLVKEQEEIFSIAFAQFASTVHDSLVANQKQIRTALESLSILVSESARLMGAEFPFYDYSGLTRSFQPQHERAGIESNTTCEADLRSDHWRAYGTDENFTPGTIEDINTYSAERGFAPSPVEEYYDVIRYRLSAMIGPMYALQNETVFSNVAPYSPAPDGAEEAMHQLLHDQLPGQSKVAHPHTVAFHPIRISQVGQESPVVGALYGILAWDYSLRNLLPDNISGLDVVGYADCIGQNPLRQHFTYRINGKDAFYTGEGDLHDPKYSKMAVTVDVDFHQHPDYRTTPGHCYYSFRIYPSDDFHADYRNGVPALFTMSVAATFLLMIVVFFVYDWVVQRRNRKLVFNAAKSNEVINGMFPATLRDKVLDQTRTAGKLSVVPKRIWTAFGNLDDSGHDDSTVGTSEGAPLAELYLETTIVFADICGFTAWSSVREPVHVFQLLEKIFSAYDSIARSQKVFKVETVGDCYVAVTGFPDSQPDHAVRMARFAKTCLDSFSILVRNLEVRLGPDTGDLGLRIGLHSGQITAGVLRGDRARFHLFGDTVNFAARMESTGQIGKIQASSTTAALISKGGMAHWISRREDSVAAKGKGAVETFWIKCTESSHSMLGTLKLHNDLNPSFEEAEQRLIEWNVGQLIGLIRKIVACRNVVFGARTSKRKDIKTLPALCPRTTFLDEVQEVIELPKFDSRLESTPSLSDDDISEVVISELRVYISNVATLIHDLDHPGVPNARLIAEQPYKAERFRYRSVAEQNSLDLAWTLLMRDEFENLRATLFATNDELVRFRKLVVNSVLATDIADKDLKALRNKRWNTAFSSSADNVKESVYARNRKATIVIEHLIQASDVAHTMQHWHIYRKWNERLFAEEYTAFRKGRSEKNPADRWADGEIGFFDSYIIPLAKKLKECGVFGISSDEYLNYAVQNRAEWENRGAEVVAEMMAKFETRTYKAWVPPSNGGKSQKRYSRSVKNDHGQSIGL